MAWVILEAREGTLSRDFPGGVDYGGPCDAQENRGSYAGDGTGGAAPVATLRHRLQLHYLSRFRPDHFASRDGLMIYPTRELESAQPLQEIDCGCGGCCCCCCDAAAMPLQAHSGLRLAAVQTGGVDDGCDGEGGGFLQSRNVTLPEEASDRPSLGNAGVVGVATRFQVVTTLDGYSDIIHT